MSDIIYPSENAQSLYRKNSVAEKALRHQKNEHALGLCFLQTMVLIGSILLGVWNFLYIKKDAGS